MRHGSLFSGIGGFDLAAEWMGWQNIFHCEWEAFPKKILKHYWPEAVSYDDITKTDFTIHRGQIDILTGGFPCQPYSAAGKRLGKKDERHLWPEMLRAIKEIAPTYVVGENVRGLVNWSGGLVFDEVQADLEDAGFEVCPFILPACAVNAPHRRDRVWFVAYDTNARVKSMRHRRQNTIYGLGITTDTASNRREWKWQGVEAKEGLQQEPEPGGELAGRLEGLCVSGNATNTKRVRHRGSAQATGSDNTEQVGRLDTDGRRNGCEVRGEVAGRGGASSNTSNQGLQGSQDNGSATGGRQERDEQLAGCVRPNWQNFPTQSPVCSGNDGLPDRLDGVTFPKWRNESIKAYGNAIVPQVAFEIFKAIEAYEAIQ